MAKRADERSRDPSASNRSPAVILKQLFVRPYNDEAGDWRGLDSPTQIPRYAVIADILHSFGADGSVLDVGCGETVLRGYLPKGADYTGIEPSSSAVRIALERNASTKIIHTRAENFDALGERFDSIVFNEMLYYAADPVGLLRKYAELLRRGGMILCSIYQKPSRVSLRHGLWHLLDRRRPLSNFHCEKMVRGFMAREEWSILDDHAVTIPGNSSRWHIWLAAPRLCHVQKSSIPTPPVNGFVTPISSATTLRRNNT